MYVCAENIKEHLMEKTSKITNNGYGTSLSVSLPSIIGIREYLGGEWVVLCDAASVLCDIVPVLCDAVWCC
jgi:hypothetical protein